MSQASPRPALTSSLPHVNWSVAGQRVPMPIEAAREIEQGDADAWRAPYRGLAQLGIFGVALPEEHGGAGGTVDDLCAMVDEAAAAMVPGPIATTALATLVLGASHAELLEALASGERTAGVAASADLRYDARPGIRNCRIRARCRYRRGAAAARGRRGSARRRHRRRCDRRTAEGHRLLPPAGAGAAGLRTRRGAARFGRSGSRISPRPCSPPRPPGLARWTLRTATEYAKVREQFGKPIGSFQAIKHMCAEMLLRSEQISVAACDAAAAVANPDERQLSIAAAVAASTAIEAAKANAKDCIQVLGGIGITWEHDAHLYLRRAYGIAQFLGGLPHWLRRIAALTQPGRPPRTARRSGFSCGSAARNRFCGSRSRRAARREAASGACRDRAAGAALAATLRPRSRVRPSSC